MANQKKIYAYKFHGLDGSWAIILSYDEYSASELFQRENNISEEDISLIESIDLETRISNVYTEKRSTILEMAKNVKFFPRCILDSNDQ